MFDQAQLQYDCLTGSIFCTQYPEQNRLGFTLEIIGSYLQEGSCTVHIQDIQLPIDTNPPSIRGAVIKSGTYAYFWELSFSWH